MNVPDTHAYGGVPGRSSRRSVADRALEAEQELLHLGSAAVVADLPPRLQDAVAGDDERERVVRERAPGRAVGTGVARPGGDLAVARRGPEGELAGGRTQ